MTLETTSGAVRDNPPRVGWDLHCHTVFSDGTRTPRELVELAVSAGLLGVAITDHDTSSGWRAAAKAAREAGLPLLRGTEITSEFGRTSVHMLAYQYDPHSARIIELFHRTRMARLTRAKVMVERLANDFPISWESVLDQVKEGDQTTVGRPHIADALVHAGVYGTRSEAFAGAINSRSRYYVPTPSPAALDVVRTVRDAGGVTVVAHPADAGRNRILLSDTQIEQLAGAGLDGLEVWHRGNAPEQRMRLLGLARRFNLLTTGGSDWHGSGKPNRLGEHLTAQDTVRRIVERGAIDLAGGPMRTAG